jgi:hypothetical protein
MLNTVIVFLINIVTGINPVELFVLVLFSDTLLGIMALKKSGLTTRGVNLINSLNSNSLNSALIGRCNFSQRKLNTSWDEDFVFLGYDSAALGDRYPIFRRKIFGHSDHSNWGHCVLSEVLCKIPKLTIRWRLVMYQKNRILNHITVKNWRLASHSTIWHELLNFLFFVTLTRFDYRTVNKSKVSFNLKQTKHGKLKVFSVEAVNT